VRSHWAEKGIEKPNLVLLSLDTTRADRLGCYGYAPGGTPSIDSLAASNDAQAAEYKPITKKLDVRRSNKPGSPCNARVLDDVVKLLLERPALHPARRGWKLPSVQRY